MEQSKKNPSLESQSWNSNNKLSETDRQRSAGFEYWVNNPNKSIGLFYWQIMGGSDEYICQGLTSAQIDEISCASKSKFRQCVNKLFNNTILDVHHLNSCN